MTPPDSSLHRQVVDHIATAILVAHIDAERSALSVVTANPAAGRLLGREPDELPGQRLAEVLGPVDDSVLQRIRAVADGAPGITIERVEEIGVDRQRTFSLQVFPLPGAAVGLAFDDVTGATMVAAALRRQALHDGLTGLPNRTLLRDRLRFALAEAKRREERVALILLDLDHFKEVNDTLGHQYGDRLLTAFARRLQELLRECDTIARLGGDEFALLLTRATRAGATRVAEKVTKAMAQPFELDGVTIQTQASLGIAVYPDHAEDADLLTQRADVAMYSAKRGGSGWSYYAPAHDESSLERLALLSDLHHELDELRPESMTVHYQPVLDLASRRVTGAEALLRWDHPSLGQLNPDLVLELAELTGLVNHLVRYVAETSAATVGRLHARGVELTVSVNLSSRNLYDRTLSSWLLAIVEDAGLPPSALRCELPASQLMDDPMLAMDVVSDLHDIGIATSVDRFGLTTSSLSYLRRLPADEIKLDRSFVVDMNRDADAAAVARATIDLAHGLDKRVVAEGVEDDGVLRILDELGCDRVQGPLVGTPVPAEALESTVAAWPSATGHRYPSRP